MSVIQRVFNSISLTRDESLWMSSDDSASRLDDRLEMLAGYDECGPDFAGAMAADAGALRMARKNEKVKA